MAGYKDERKAVRLFLLADEHRAVRLAAAAAGVSMAEFCRQAAVEQARATPIEVPGQRTAEAKPKRGRGRPRKEER